MSLKYTHSIQDTPNSLGVQHSQIVSPQSLFLFPEGNIALFVRCSSAYLALSNNHLSPYLYFARMELYNMWSWHIVDSNNHLSK